MSDEQKARDLVNYLLSEIDLSPADACLDLGCGFGNLVVALSGRLGNVSGIELIDERAEWSKIRCPSAEIVCGTAETLPWPDEHFKLITSTDVFEHLDHSQQNAAAKEVARVLKPGGYCFITVPSRFQVIDEHNYVPFGTWMPDRLREFAAIRLNGTYVRCWEHSGTEWARIFTRTGLTVKMIPKKHRITQTTSRFHLFAHKPLGR